MSEENTDVLSFQDEMEIHRFPTLTRMWAPLGQQPQVPTPGKNEKQVGYGGGDYATGKLTYTIADTKCGAAFLLFLTVLLRTYAGRKIRLVGDHGRFPTTKAVQQFVTAPQEHREIYWLPPYCPSLNLIERLWGHLKRTVLANVLSTSLNDLVQAFRTGVRRLSGHRDRMGFMFRHDAIPAATPSPLLKLAA